MTFIMVGLSIYGFGTVIGEFKEGKAYTLAVFFGEGTKIDREISPFAFWMNLGWQVLGFASIIVLAVWTVCETFAARRNWTKNSK